jgi:hypothetical protein
MRILGADKPRQRASRVDFERFARAVSATEGMHAIRLIGCRGDGFFHLRQEQQTGLGHPCDRYPSSPVAVSIEVNYSCGEVAHGEGVCTTGAQARHAVARASPPQGTARPAQGPRTPRPGGRSRCRSNRRRHDPAGGRHADVDHQERGVAPAPVHDSAPTYGQMSLSVLASKAHQLDRTLSVRSNSDWDSSPCPQGSCVKPVALPCCCSQPVARSGRPGDPAFASRDIPARHITAAD